ncbi:MAG: 3-methylornithyl-N6-L-lysine dehydrogenase PylD [Desulfobacterales bacterium]|nr:3-methylornithyl-N6-L-lysine dehydrogenase PylD [Desulfobacterales bacterium]
MTRLRTEDISDISDDLDGYDICLSARTGRALLGIACHVAGVSEKEIGALISTTKVGIVPITSGKGIISGFTETVESIVKHLGFNTFITKSKDMAGIAEAVKQSDIIMSSDDNDFVAFNLDTRIVIHNTPSTALAYTAALSLMTGGLSGKKTLILGCGPVGKYAANASIKKGAVITLHDRDHNRSQLLADELKRSYDIQIKVEDDLNTALSENSFIIEATTSAGIITEKHILPETYICAPGVPCGLTTGAVNKIGDRFVHDTLQLGVAVMAITAVTSGIKNNQVEWSDN